MTLFVCKCAFIYTEIRWKRKGGKSYKKEIFKGTNAAHMLLKYLIDSISKLYSILWEKRK